MMESSILVTGGAGYIGSHVVRQLGEAGERVVTLDNLSAGNREAVLYGAFVEGDTGDYDLVRQVILDHNVKTIMHFAAFTVVPESVSDPVKYYKNNTCNALSLIKAATMTGVENFIFSSTAAVYGVVGENAVTEETPVEPINPYGYSKLMTEQILADTAAAIDSFEYVALRYFNVAGADPECRIGPNSGETLLLIKAACEVAVGKREKIYVFGDDYATPDGTGIRDYIHVEDIASAHLSTLKYLRQGGQSTVMNCGYGHGYSVREVLDTVQKVHGAPINIEQAPRREGDAPSVVANADKLRLRTGWQPSYDNLTTIVSNALAWERSCVKKK